MSHPACLPTEQLLTHCRVSHTRRSGPGGQHRNKVQTAVVVEHLPSGQRGEASERRSQLQNKQAAIQRLRVNLALSLRSEPLDQPSTAWKSRLSGGRIAVNPGHEDFPKLLAEVLDVLAADEYDIPPTAARLGVSSSQLIKFLRIERRALELVNESRNELGLGKLS